MVTGQNTVRAMLPALQTVAVLLAAVHCAAGPPAQASPQTSTTAQAVPAGEGVAAPATSSLPITPKPQPGAPDEFQSVASTDATAAKSMGPGWLGVELAAMPPAQAGVQIREVLPGSPAQAAGLLTGDVILQVDGTAVERPQQVIAIVMTRNAGERLGLVLLRQGQQRLLNVALGARPDSEALLKQRYLDAPAPDLTTGQVAQGKVTPSLYSLRGRVVVLEFWASWCLPCRALLPTMNSWHDRYSAQGVTVVGVTANSVAEAALDASTLGMRYNIIADPDARITRDYRALALPTLFVIDKRGNVRDVMVGFQPDRMTQIGHLLERLLQES